MGGSDSAKRAAAHAAVDRFVTQDGMVVGVGSGSTVVFVAERLGQIAKERGWTFFCVPTSFQSEGLIRENGLTMTTLSLHPCVEVAFDGADECVSGSLSLIKGGGGCQLQEKIVAFNAKKFVVVADASKVSEGLGTAWTKGVPIEVVPMAQVPLMDTLRGMKAEPVLRMAKAKAGPVVTDTGNFIIDAVFEDLADPGAVGAALAQLPGVVEHGLFVGMAEIAFIGNDDGSVSELVLDGKGASKVVPTAREITEITIEEGDYLVKRGPAMRFRLRILAHKQFEWRRIKLHADNGTWIYADDFMNPESEGSWKCEYGRVQFMASVPKKFFLDFLAPNSKGEYLCINNLDEIMTREEIKITEVAAGGGFAQTDMGYDAFDMGSDSDEFAGCDMGSDDNDDE